MSIIDGKQYLERIFERLREIYPTFPLKPIATEYARNGESPFKVLISTVLSLRTKDPVTLAATEKLWQKAQTPATMLKLSASEISELIYPVGFFRRKAEQILAISKILIDEYGGEVPADLEKLKKLPGVGLKTANLVAGVSFGIPAICVDIHVHRICNRLGFIQTQTPEESELALKTVIPQENWIELNDLLVAFGQNICVPISPKCQSSCPIREHCPRIGVGKSR
ncbi:endonuclease III [Candidatus Gracilibacteria bacterium]|jgi:endonuclease-3|nr:endonuclease III [Candidatus Gracilibacteria bacterium]